MHLSRAVKVVPWSRAHRQIFHLVGLATQTSDQSRAALYAHFNRCVGLRKLRKGPASPSC
jgi:hypothetical protein